MRMKKLLLTVVAGLTFGLLAAKDDIPKVPIWDRIELTFDSPARSLPTPHRSSTNGCVT